MGQQDVCSDSFISADNGADTAEPCTDEGIVNEVPGKTDLEESDDDNGQRNLGASACKHVHTTGYIELVYAKGLGEEHAATHRELSTWEGAEASPPLEEQLRLSRQEERTLHSELTLARSQLATCEARLLQCRQRLCQLGHELSEEKRCQGGDDDLSEQLSERRRTVAQLSEELREANLEALALADADHKHWLEASEVWSELAEFPGAIDGSTFDEFVSADDDVAIMGQLQDEDYVADVVPITSQSDCNKEIDDGLLPTSSKVISALALVRRYCVNMEGCGLSCFD
ncbi:hypothetical protein HPB50_005030 [Hyalomma asiaticum]|uniref:Uncharacterized protein n=1 Tax=Hyalomma asiaticum TaxID=266040 RepID=A0ACB7SKX7_HYAAI|nr:hypothetical protein HPB50_005030 [Hyalomma asiaticum]